MNPGCLSVCGVLFLASVSLAEQTRFQFRESHHTGYLIENPQGAARSTGKKSGLKAQRENAPDQLVEFTERIGLQLQPGANLHRLIAGKSLRVIREVNSSTFILEAPDAWTSAVESENLSANPEVLTCVPLMHELSLKPNSYAPKPNDPEFSKLWHLENRSANGDLLGLDLNARAAWPVTRGEGLVIGIADEAVETNHPDLVSRQASALHHNFFNDSANLDLGVNEIHATSVAGLAVAEMNNGAGISGVAPGAKFASWRIFSTNGVVVTGDKLGEMFAFGTNNVAVQNHSWGSTSRSFLRRDPFAEIGIQNAIQTGRSGRGTIMVRGAGNRRTGGYENGIYTTALLGNANDDGYCADPRVVVVAAARSDGRATFYSSPGACILVGAPGSESTSGDTTIIDPAFRPLFTATRNGNYGNFLGTSGSAPEIAGIAALMLSVNTNLTYRDVQQILVLSSRHVDFSDADIATNGAGFFVSHNLGFGIPDAGLAVKIAKNWSNRPTATNLIFSHEFSGANLISIPDDGLRVVVTNGNALLNLKSIAASPGTGPVADSPTAILPLVDVGLANTALSVNLAGKAALIQRGGATFSVKINNAAEAGAAFAIIYGSASAPTRTIMTGTDFTTIPAVSISQTDGEALRNFLQTNGSASVQLNLNSAKETFAVTNQLLCEFVGVRIRTDNLRRADIRITLTSPAGTRSILQRVTQDPSTNAPIDWTYFTTHHFFESSVGTWTVEFSDQASGGAIGKVDLVELQLSGVPISDSDGDGLSDAWEIVNSGSLAQNAPGDPDKDGCSNMREQLLGTNPNSAEPLNLDFSRWENGLARIAWPGNAGFIYSIKAGAEIANLTPRTNIAGRFPETELFVPYTNGNQFFKVTAQPIP